MITIDNKTDILAIIDVQPTFMPGGELPVPDGDAVVPVINMLMRDLFQHAFASQDWHPAGHSSFASSHDGKEPFSTILTPYGPQTLWPDHAIQNSRNAALHPDLDQSKIELIVRKGFRHDIDGYSAFLENAHKTFTGLDEWLRARSISRIFFVGLATDFCVGFSAEDAILAGYEAIIIEDACRGIGMPTDKGHTSMSDMRDVLESLDVQFINSSDLTLIHQPPR